MNQLTSLCRWLVRCRWPAAAVWILLMIACSLRLLTVPMSNQLTELSGATDTEAYQVDQILRQSFGFRTDTTLALVFKAAPPEDLQLRLKKRFPQLEAIRAQPGRRNPALRCWFLFFTPQTAFADVQTLVPRIREFVSPLLPEQVFLTGNAAFYNDFLEASQTESALSDLLALGFAFWVMIFTFGGIIGALLPLLMGITTLLLFNGLLNVFRIQITPVSLLMTSVLGLALSIDYAFFLVSRYQEERSVEPNPATALSRTLKSTGRTVLVSGLLVVMSTAALMLPNLSVQRTNAFNLVCVAAVATLNALLSLPTLMVLTGPWLAWPERLSRRFHSQRKYRFWQRYARHVVARPKRYFALSLLLLLALAAPAVNMRLWDPLQTMAPAKSESVRGYQVLQADGWGGLLIPIQLVLETPEGMTPAALNYLYDLGVALRALPGVAAVQSPLPPGPKPEALHLYRQLQTAGSLFAPLNQQRYVLLNVQQSEMMDILQSYELIRRIRDYARLHPALHLRTGGVVARTNDFISELYSYSPHVLSLVILGILLVLIVYMRSPILPLKASLMNFLPILSAFGILVLIFQQGVLADVLHLPHHGAIINLVPMTLFCLVFSLSMDYEILIISRITEAYADCHDVGEAIVEGLARSSSVITGAALILIMVFVPALFFQSAIMKEIAVGIIAALILDATLVRLLLVPSFMMLMGRWNWWNPFRRDTETQV